MQLNEIMTKKEMAASWRKQNNISGMAAICKSNKQASSIWQHHGNGGSLI